MAILSPSRMGEMEERGDPYCESHTHNTIFGASGECTTEGKFWFTREPSLLGTQYRYESVLVLVVVVGFPHSLLFYYYYNNVTFFTTFFFWEKTRFVFESFLLKNRLLSNLEHQAKFSENFFFVQL